MSRSSITQQTADIAIVGGGIIGMSCAYELSRQGAHVVLFDKSNLASGTTGASGGVICLHDMGEIYAYLTLLGYTRVRQLQRDHDFPFNSWGWLHVKYEPSPFPPAPSEYYRRFASGESSIYHHIVFDREELLHRYPWIKPDRVVGGVYYPNQGYIDPYALVALYERLALETGRARVYRNTPVLQIRTQDDRITTVVTRRGAWAVQTVLNAGGPWGAKVAALAGSELALTPQRIQVCMATAFDDGIDYAPISSVPEALDDEIIWCRGELGGTMLFAQHHEKTTPGYTVDPDHVNRVNDPEFPDKVGQLYRKYWRLPKSVFLNGWCCVYGTTEDGFPIISRDERLGNFFHAVGLNGHGITCHAGVAQAISELILRERTVLDMTDVLGRRGQLDFSVLNTGRFARGELLTFDLS